MEPGYVVLIALLTMVLGVMTGMVIAKRMLRHTETRGTIYAYCGDSSPSLLLEPSVAIEELVAQKQVLFEVVVIR